jgi:hypothetical protein
MGKDPRKRQKVLAAKRARLAARRARRRQPQAGPRLCGHGLSEIRRAPLLSCSITADLLSEGVGYVVVSRDLGAETAFASFMTDLYCTGVKSLVFTVIPAPQFRETMAAFEKQTKLRTVAPAYARKLVEQSAEYAASLGLSAPADLAKALAIFGDADPADCRDTFTFGKDGKPCFVASSFDSEPRRNMILNTLRARLGPEGFAYVIADDGMALAALEGNLPDGMDAGEEEDEERDGEESEADALADEIIAEGGAKGGGAAHPEAAEKKKFSFRKMLGFLGWRSGGK